MVDAQYKEIEELVANFRNPKLPSKQQRRQLDLLKVANEEHLDQREGNLQLEARIASFELAYRIQSEAIDLFDVSDESEDALDMYGPGMQAQQILIARRLVERSFASSKFGMAKDNRGTTMTTLTNTPHSPPNVTRLSAL